jgi:hypothetical protein
MGMLLFSATLEASHSCGELVLHSWQHGSGSAERAYGDGGICLTCITLQAAAQAVCYSAWSPTFVTAEAVDSDELPAPSIEQHLALYSRPPPVLS